MGRVWLRVRSLRGMYAEAEAEELVVALTAHDWGWGSGLTMNAGSVRLPISNSSQTCAI